MPKDAVEQRKTTQVLPTWWWTGPVPDTELNVLPMPNLETCTREDVLAYFDNGWLLNEVLFTGLCNEDAFMVPPPHGLRHPLIFYYGHTAVLFVNKLRVAGLITEPINAYYERLFEVGVDEMSWDDMSKNEMHWPSLQDVNAYRKTVYNLVKQTIQTHPGLDAGHPTITSESSLWALFMAFEHERIHFETSSVLMRELDLQYVRPPVLWPASTMSGDTVPTEPLFAAIPAGKVVLGKPSDYPSYGWDNEYGTREVTVEKFSVSKHLVTNAQFLAFVKDGGYTTANYWTTEGWAWRSYKNTKKPAFWRNLGPEGLHDYALRTIFEEIPMPMDWPVCVNFHEARAYLAWLSKKDNSTYRLLTEAEHAYLRRDSEADFALTSSTIDLRQNRNSNVCLATGTESPVTWSKPNRYGVHDVSGNVWDWCEDNFNPLDGFKTHPYYEDFSTPCFDGEHSMILGGSFMSCGDEASMWARFHFRRHFFQHAGFHVVQGGWTNLATPSKSAAKYDDKKVLDQYLLFHYGSPTNSTPKNMSHVAAFSERAAHLVIDAVEKTSGSFGRVLDVGCAVGAASFELAKHFDNVTGVDISSQFINTAKALQNGEDVPYRMAVEGASYIDLTVSSKAHMQRKGIEFRRADACALPAEYQDFDAVLASNLLDRLPSPRAFLSRLGGVCGLVKPGGILVLGSPFTWSEQYTPQESWLCDNKGRGSFEKLVELLRRDFELLEHTELPFMIREHVRKYEYVVSDFSVWQRKL